jgi:hypothetical protein
MHGEHSGCAGRLFKLTDPRTDDFQSISHPRDDGRDADNFPRKVVSVVGSRHAHHTEPRVASPVGGPEHERGIS